MIGRHALRAHIVAALLGSTLLAATPLHAKPAHPVPAAPVHQDRRPNILFVLIDDMGFGDLSIMGNRKVATPNIDRLAKRGVLMTRFYDAAPICSPSRAGFFTGRFPPE